MYIRFMVQARHLEKHMLMHIRQQLNFQYECARELAVMFRDHSSFTSIDDKHCVKNHMGTWFPSYSCRER